MKLISCYREILIASRIEVKAEQNLRAKSLKAFCDKYQPDMAVRSSMANYKKEDWLINVPLYMLAEYLKNMVHAN